MITTKRQTCFSRWIGVLLLAGFVLSPVEANEVVVASGETLELNSVSLTNNLATVIRAMGGSTLTISPLLEVPAEGAWGFTAYHGTTLPTDDNWPAAGTTEAAALADFKYTTVQAGLGRAERVHLYETDVVDRQFDIYAATWHVDEAMTISLFEHFASKVLVILDGTVVLSDKRWNGTSTTKGISVAAGDHALVLVLATEGEGKCTPTSGSSNKNSGGRYGHANAQNVPGLVYNTANADLTLENLASGVGGVAGTAFFQNASEADTTFTTYAPSALLPLEDETVPNPAIDVKMRILVDGGPVRLDLSKANLPGSGVRMYGGLLATNAGSIVVVGTDTLRVGGYSDTLRHWTPFGVPLTFECADGSPNSAGTVAFEEYATVFTMPARKTFASGLQLAIRGANLLEDEALAQSTQDVQLQSPDVCTEGATIAVTNRTVALKPCMANPDNMWNWYGIPGAFTNDFVLGGETAKLALPNVTAVAVRGSVSGNGVIEADIGQTDQTTAVTTFEGPVTLEGEVRAITGSIVFNQATPGHASNRVVLSENPYSGSGYNEAVYGSVRLNPEGAGTVETTASIRRVDASCKRYQKADKTYDTPMNGRIFIPRLQTLHVGTFSGQGCVWGDDRDAAPAACSVDIDVLETNSLLRAIVRKRCSIGRMDPGSTVRMLSSLETFEVEDLEGGARAIVQGTTEVRIGAGSKGTLVVDSTTGTVPLTLGANGDATDGTLGALLFASAATVVVTNGAIQAVSGSGTLVIAGNVRLGLVAPETAVRVLEGGHITWSAQAVSGVPTLGADIDPAVWFDADAGASTYRQLSLAGHPNVTYTNDSVEIDQWYDVRPWQRTYYGWNRRCEGTTETHQQIYPYLLANSCNGRTTLQFDTFGNIVYGVWSASFANDGTANRAGRRLPFNEPIKARCAIMVFGSENGGGTAVLGGYTNKENGYPYSTPAPLQRFADEYYTEDALQCWDVKGATYAVARDWTQPIFHESRPTWVDGVAVDPTTTGFDGGYQILSFEIADSTGTNGVPVQSLGACGKHGNDAAGQIYGEVLIFTNALTTAQRQRVEFYLSRKWGIPLKGDVAASASVDIVGGGTVDVEGDSYGVVAFPGATSLALGGDFRAAGVQRGTVSLAGGTLDIPALGLPPSEGDIPTADQRAWYDPDDETRYLKRTIANDTRPLAVDALFSKFSGTTSATYDGVAYLSGFLGQTDYATADANNKADRRPWKSVGARGTGPVRTWLDYTVYPEGDSSGNCLRPKTKFSEWSVFNSTTRAAQSFKTAFIVTDTSTGGGNPICDLYAMTPTKVRTGYKVSAAIWPTGSLAAFTNGVTRLDGAVVDGSTRGYSGRPELLTVQTDGTDAQFYALGYYNGKGVNGESKERSHEILGEMLFYTTVLDDAARSGIEAYLMKKWLGKVPQGYVDWREATVTGSGTVAAPSSAYLPNFDAAFSGTVSLGDGALTFALDETGAVTNAISLPAGVVVKLPATGTVTVVGSGKVKNAVLIDAGAVEMGACVKNIPTGWTLEISPACEDARLKVEGGYLKLVRSSGLTILIR